MIGPVGLLLLSVSVWAAPSPAEMEGKTCTDFGCHADLQIKATIHDPVAKGMCNPCHTQARPGAHEFQPGYPKETLCLACHILTVKNHVHQPVKDGRCIDCHDPHQSEFNLLLRADPSKDLCLICHAKDAFMNKRHLHGPVAMGACILCHDSHSSWKPKLLVAEGNELCATCHEDKILRDQQARHVHPPATGDCDKCHDPHGSDFPQQMRDEDRKFCVSCHEDIGQLIEKSPVVHGAVTEKQECRNCHAGHSSSLPTLLKSSLLDTCLGCHNEEIPRPNGKNVANMAALLKENPNHHGPIRQADCSACHNPHASLHTNLLTETYPELFYAPFNPDDYKLCFTCHRSELVATEQGRGLTQFRNGDLNLHYVHVSKPRKGRTCRACHAVHASKSPAHISELVPYGNWQYEIKFESKSNGGTCAPACHAAKSYERTDTPPATQPAGNAKPAE
ncbi:MAG: cytochrome C [Planctomycetaceae bacterium]|nr:MAG: cytochrome C [Planctomycetaceae bacterium]